MKLDWIIVARDAVGAVVFQALAVYAAAAATDSAGVVFGAAFAALAIAFCVSGCLAREQRFRHLAVVAGGVFVLGALISAGSGTISLVGLIQGLVQVVATVVLGGLVSLAIARPQAPAPPPPGT